MRSQRGMSGGEHSCLMGYISPTLDPLLMHVLLLNWLCCKDSRPSQGPLRTFVTTSDLVRNLRTSIAEHESSAPSSPHHSDRHS